MNTFSLILTILILMILILLSGAVVLASLYNKLIYSKNQVEKAFASIDVYLQKRCDLIPNLVAIAQRYMKFEQKTLTEIARLRRQVVSGEASGNTRVDLENQISRTLENVMLAVEAYPELRTNELFIKLQESLNEVEEQLSASRRFYNSSVNDYNNAMEMFPMKYIASVMNYQRKSHFQSTPQSRQNIDIKSLFNQ